MTKRKLVRIEVDLEGTSSEIAETLLNIYKVCELKEIISMSTATMDTFQGYWTETQFIKIARRILREYPYTRIRKAGVQRE